MKVSTLALGSLYDGRTLIEFGTIHEVAEQIMGYPIWTHQSAVEALWDEMKARVAELLPDIVSVPKDGDWRAYRDAILEKFGEFVDVELPEQRPPDMKQVLGDLPEGKPTIIVFSDD